MPRIDLKTATAVAIVTATVIGGIATTCRTTAQALVEAQRRTQLETTRDQSGWISPATAPSATVILGTLVDPVPLRDACLDPVCTDCGCGRLGARR